MVVLEEMILHKVRLANREMQRIVQHTIHKNNLQKNHNKSRRSRK
jgi:hypothetical protein